MNEAIKDGQYAFEYIDGSHERIVDVIHSEAFDLGDPSKVVIGGFGNGGVMSIKCGCEYSFQLGGIMSYSGFYAFGYTGHSSESKETPIFAHHG